MTPQRIQCKRTKQIRGPQLVSMVSLSRKARTCRIELLLQKLHADSLVVISIEATLNILDHQGSFSDTRITDNSCAYICLVSCDSQHSLSAKASQSRLGAVVCQDKCGSVKGNTHCLQLTRHRDTHQLSLRKHKQGYFLLSHAATVVLHEM